MNASKFGQLFLRKISVLTQLLNLFPKMQKDRFLFHIVIV